MKDILASMAFGLLLGILTKMGYRRIGWIAIGIGATILIFYIILIYAGCIFTR